MKKFSGLDAQLILHRLALVVFIIFPVTLALIAQFFRLVQNWDIVKTFQIVLLVGVFLAPIIALFAKDTFWMSIEKSRPFPALWIIVVSVTLRIVLVPLISTDFVSDMEDVHLFATDIYSGNPFANLNNYPNIPYATYLTLTGIILSFVYKIFGASTATAKFLLVFLAGLTTWLVYLTGREIAGERVGFVAAFFYATLPSLLCYTGVLVGDHFALPLMVLAILVQIRLSKSDPDKFSLYIPGYILCGVLVGLVDWFRPVGMTLLAALIISILIFQLKKRVFFQTALALVVLILSYFTISKMAIVITENMFQTVIPSLSQRIGGYVLVGLNPETTGGVNLEDSQTIGETYIRFGNDYSAANRYLIETALGRLEQGEMAKLLKEKFILVWSSHEALFDYSLLGSNDQELVYLLGDFESLLYLMITFFMLISTITSIIKKSHPAIFSMQLFILGFAILMLLLEVQNRYVLIVFPYSIILGTIGMEDAISSGFLRFVKQEWRS
jgi:4-amino-4-deoxy-L-arabinose transferase-like glycosyltransferase